MSNWFLDYFTSNITSRIWKPVPLNTCMKSKAALGNYGKVIGSHTRFAIMLTYDSLMRRKKLDPKHEYDTFESDVIWMITRIVDIENDSWNPTEVNTTSGAYGYWQILNNDWFDTAITRMRNQIHRSRAVENRTWLIPKHLGFKDPENMARPVIIDQIERELAAGKTKEQIIDGYSPDFITAFMVSYIAEAAGTDEAFINLHDDPAKWTKVAYYKGHHQDERLVSKNVAQLMDGSAFDKTQVVYNGKPYKENYSVYLRVEKKVDCTQHMPAVNYQGALLEPICTATHTEADEKAVLNLIKTRVKYHDLYDQMKRLEKYGYIVENVTSEFLKAGYAPHFTKLFHDAVDMEKLRDSTVIYSLRRPDRSWIRYYWGRFSSDKTYDDYMSQMQMEIANSDAEELYKSIDYWTESQDVYLVHFFAEWESYKVPDDDEGPGIRPWDDDASPAQWGTAYHGLYTKGLDESFITLGTASKGVQLSTWLHEIGGHHFHEGTWGHGDHVAFTNEESDNINDSILNAYQTIRDIPRDLQIKRISALENPIFKHYIKAAWTYTDKRMEDEILSRLYGLMGANRCITFTEHVLPLLRDIGLEISDETARKVDNIMRYDMKLDKRTYK